MAAARITLPRHHARQRRACDVPLGVEVDVVEQQKVEEEERELRHVGPGAWRRRGTSWP